SLLRGYFHGADDDTVDDLQNERLATLTLPLGARAIGRKLEHFALHALGVRVVSLRRAGGKNVPVDDATPLEGGDTLVLSGRSETLAVAEQKLLSG
ncbi:MAG TPA: TrkA C-terminal domain-containing protein, partial [Ramlibacter sp.]|nr:TrkA C-terminal domain-containing protein [Ramlibacter sp.]